MKKVFFAFIMLGGLIFAQDEWINITPDGVTDFQIWDLETVGPDTILFTGIHPNLYISEDGGNSWYTKPIEFTTYGDMAIDRYNNIYMVSFGHMIKSTNFGDSWAKIDGNFNDLEFYSICEFQDTLYVGNFDNIFYSTDFGDTWVPTNFDAPATGLGKDAHNLYTGGAALSNFGFHVSTDNGETWQFFGFATGSYAANQDGEILLNDIDAGLKFSSDYGKTFQNVNYFPTTDYNINGTNCLSSRRFFLFRTDSDAPVNNALYTSNSVHETWHKIGFSGKESVRTFVDSYDHLYVAVEDEGLYLHAGPYTPVELTGFSGYLSGRMVELKWETASELNNKGFEIERKTGDRWDNLAFIDGAGSSTQKQLYSYTDENPVTGTCYYRLKQIDFDGTYSYSDIIEVDVHPASFMVGQNYPNPFNPSTKIMFTLPVASIVKISVYNNLGQKVKETTDYSCSSGSNFIELSAEYLSSGIYFYELVAHGENGINYSNVKKMIVLK